VSSALNDLAEAGVSVWLDDLSRLLMQTKSHAKLVDDAEIVGITTNPTIFARAIGSGSGYEDQLRNSRCAARPSGNSAASDCVGRAGSLRCLTACIRALRWP
jgi:transaldolase